MTKNIVLNGIEFRVDGTGTLVKMINRGKAKDVFIPYELPTGKRISTIWDGFCQGKYLTITIDNRISLMCCNAFSFADVQKVVWPSSCKTIPAWCFSQSKIEILDNIDNVENIAEGAFRKTKLNHFKWPNECKNIPKCCFSDSQLKEITNISNVEDIHEFAFSGTSLMEFNWPPKCKNIPNGCFYFSSLKSISGIENVEAIGDRAFECCVQIKEIIWPAACIEVPIRCFYNCENLKTLDFSNAMTLTIGMDALLKTPNAKIIYPYYALVK